MNKKGGHGAKLIGRCDTVSMESRRKSRRMTLGHHTVLQVHPR